MTISIRLPLREPLPSFAEYVIAVGLFLPLASWDGHVSRLGSSLWLSGLVYGCPGNPSRVKETWSWALVSTSGEETPFSPGVALLVEYNPGAAPGSFASSWD